ncbi:MAG: membrane protein insertion efficiency factor YidD [Treponema sp.]|nr:membrane protein insertion efficiency factor YidD [Treponema sp.]
MMMKNIAIKLIWFYQNAVSPHFPPVCRYYPSCSAYAMDAFNQYGFLHGCVLTVKRLMRCHPFHRGGYDPVPDLSYKLGTGLTSQFLKELRCKHPLPLLRK